MQIYLKFGNTKSASDLRSPSNCKCVAFAFKLCGFLSVYEDVKVEEIEDQSEL